MLCFHECVPADHAVHQMLLLIKTVGESVLSPKPAAPVADISGSLRQRLVSPCSSTPAVTPQHVTHGPGFGMKAWSAGACILQLVISGGKGEVLSGRQAKIGPGCLRAPRAGCPAGSWMCCARWPRADPFGVYNKSAWVSLASETSTAAHAGDR